MPFCDKPNLTRIVEKLPHDVKLMIARKEKGLFTEGAAVFAVDADEALQNIGDAAAKNSVNATLLLFS